MEKVDKHPNAKPAETEQLLQGFDPESVRAWRLLPGRIPALAEAVRALRQGAEFARPIAEAIINEQPAPRRDAVFHRVLRHQLFPSKEPAPNPVPCHDRRKWQRDRVAAVLKKLYPPNGDVPADISTAIVLRQITVEPEPECRKFRVSLPGWDTVNRALGRS